MQLTRTMLVMSLLLGPATAAFAAPPSKQIFPAIRTTDEFQALEAGDKVALVCNEGDAVFCGYCELTAKVVRRGPCSKAGTHAEIRYENEVGEDCLFVTKLGS
jgi:hypothetical protein